MEILLNVILVALFLGWGFSLYLRNKKMGKISLYIGKDGENTQDCVFLKTSDDVYSYLKTNSGISFYEIVFSGNDDDAIRSSQVISDYLIGKHLMVDFHCKFEGLSEKASKQILVLFGSHSKIYYQEQKISV